MNLKVSLIGSAAPVWGCFYNISTVKSLVKMPGISERDNRRSWLLVLALAQCPIQF